MNRGTNKRPKPVALYSVSMWPFFCDFAFRFLVNFNYIMASWEDTNENSSSEYNPDENW